MKKIFAVLALSVVMASFSVSRAQQNQVAVEVNGEKITQSELLKEFLQSEGKVSADLKKMSTIEKRKALNEYVNLFVNFRAKVADAYAMGLDTVSSLNAELKQYRDELAAPYLIDSATMQNILREAYERNAYAVHAAHILIKVDEGAPAEDTLKAYNTAMEYYKRAVAGENFYALAQEAKDAQHKHIAGEIVRKNPYEGDLGCFTVFDMVYPFENAAYTIEPGTVGKPIRTRFGYHVIKVFDRVPYYGKTKFSHIWTHDNVNPARAEARIKMAWKGLQSGETWDAMVRQHSDDLNNNRTGGSVPALSLRQMPFDYVVRISKGMKEGEISEPFQTSFGWHILRVDDLDTLPPYEDMLPFYKQRLSRDQRSANPREIYAKNARERYNYIDYTHEKVKNRWGRPTGKMMASLDEIKRLVTDSVFYGKWIFDTTLITDHRPLIDLAGNKYDAVDFGRYIARTQKTERPIDISVYVDRKFNEFSEVIAIHYADAHLEEENPEFADLIEEYRHGLMIFSYNDKMIWSKAIMDSVGFKDYYERTKNNHKFSNPNDAPYFWNERARVTAYTISDSALLDVDKALKIVNKGVKKQLASVDVQNKLKSAMAKNAKDEDLVNELAILEKGKQEVLKDNEWQPGVYVHATDKGYGILIVEKIMEPTLKTLNEARGYYLNEYQNVLEDELMAQLRKKYNVKIYQNVIDKINY